MPPRCARSSTVRGMKTRKVAAVLLIAGMLFAATASAQQVYRWVDENGRVHFSDKPPTDAKAETVDIEIKPTDLEATLRANAELQRRVEAGKLEREDDKAFAAEQERYEARLAESCRQARDRVAAIESARRLSTVDEQGNRVVYDEERRAAALTEARRQVADWCR